MRRIVVELTGRCELRCRHCLVRPVNSGRDLDVRVLERLLPEARALGFGYLSLSGGEPTLHPCFARVLDLAAEAGYRFGIVSGGWGFPAAFAHLELRRERLDVITFSLDAATEAGHDWMRGEGSFRHLMRAISLCVVANLPFTLNTAITRRNRAELEDIARLAARLGSRGLRFGHLVSTPRTALDRLELPPEERRLADVEIREFAPRCGIPVGLAPGGYTEDLFPCDALRGEELAVDCRGHLLWCCQLPRAIPGADFGGVGAGRLAGPLGRLSSCREEFRREKRERFSRENPADADFFPCRYCAGRLLEWGEGRRYAHRGEPGQGSSGDR